MANTTYLALTPSGFAVSKADNPSALLQVAMTGNYVFDNNVEMTVRATDTKTVMDASNPLDNLIFTIDFKDKIDGSLITSLTGRAYVGGGIEALEAAYPQRFDYIAKMLDFYGAMDSEGDFFDVVETRYTASSKAAIISALTTAKALNAMNAYRVQEATLAVPATSNDADLTPEQVRKALVKANNRPNYIVQANINDLAMTEAAISVMDALNIHMFIDVGELTDAKQVAAFAQTIATDDHRIRILWNPNKSRPSNATSVLARKKWRPCVGDYLAKHLLRNAIVDNNGIPAIHIPVAGYNFPLPFTGMQQLDGVNLDEEAQNILAEAGVIVVLNERYQNRTRWIYGDVLTQRNSDTSALRLANAAEIETYTGNMVIDIVKMHLLSPMSDYLNNAYRDCRLFLDACVARGLLQPSQDLGGQYYALELTPRADKPFEAVNVKFARRPEGAVRQAYLETTINK